MRFFLYGTYVPSDHLVPVSKAAEALGFAGITLPDHVVYPHGMRTRYPYVWQPGDDRPPWDESCEWPDPMVAATAVLGATASLEVLTGVFVLAIRDPIYVAKATATVAALFPGRLRLGVGAGWLREEFEILGHDFDTRGPRTAEAITVLRNLWSGRPTSHSGRFFEFPEVTMLPAPPEPVPIYIGGDAPAAIRRAADLGDGYLPPLRSADRSVELWETIVERRSRDEPDEFEFVAAAPAVDDPAGLAELSAVGIGAVHVDPFALYVRRFGGLSLSERLGALEQYAENVIQPLQGR